MTDRIFLRLSEGWALGYDRNQWIVMRSKSDKSKPRQGWRSIAFVWSTRAVLMRVLRKKGAEVAPNARVAVDSFPETFLEWLAVRDRAEAEDGRGARHRQRRRAGHRWKRLAWGVGVQKKTKPTP